MIACAALSRSGGRADVACGGLPHLDKRGVRFDPDQAAVGVDPAAGTEVERMVTTDFATARRAAPLT